VPSPLRLLATLLLVLGLPGAAAAAAAARPSIVLVLTDDQEVGLADHMPNLQALVARQGATFTRAYYNDPLCSPSRATMLTGRYAQNTGVTTNHHRLFYESGGPSRTIAVALHDAGYRTGLVGKYLNGFPDPAPTGYVPPGWDYWAVHLAPSVAVYNYEMDENGTVVGYGSAADDYAQDVYTRKALGFIDRAAADGVPFFLEVAVEAPHVPSVPAPRHADLFPDLRAPRPPSFEEPDIGDKPAFVRELGIGEPSLLGRAAQYVAGLAGGVVARHPALGALVPRPLVARTRAITKAAPDTGGIDERYRSRVRSLQAVDEMVGSIVARLRGSGRLDDSYVVFASDNGWLYGEHRLKGKGLPYEEAVRMPLYVRGPGVAPGAVLDHLVGNADLAPTFAEWAGVPPPAGSDGRSFAPLLRPGAPGAEAWRQAYPLRFDSEEGVDVEHWPTWRGVRTRRYTYAEYATGERELYDDAADPYQLRNLAGTADAGLLARLSALTGALAACEGVECRRLEDGEPATAWETSAGGGHAPSSGASN